MKKLSFFVLVICFLLIIAKSSGQATAIYFTDRNNFYNAVGDLITDNYSGYPYGGAPADLTNDQMSEFLGETRYESISFDNSNYVGDVYVYGDGTNYCAGCNGNFKLLFNNTSFTQNGGIFGVGIDIVLHTSRRSSIGDIIPGQNSLDGQILAEFSDGSFDQIIIPADVGFFGPETYFLGITNDIGISALTIGTEPLPIRHSWVIDNLTIANQNPSAAPVPEPATIILIGTGLLGLVGPSRKKLKKK